MRYAIITNPVSGKMTVDEKRSSLAKPAQILNAQIYGLDTSGPDDFARCARELARGCDVLVAAGGDGTLSDVINSVDTTRTVVSYLPLGTGNAVAYALGFRGSLSDMARRIRDGKVHELDLISCDEKKRAFMASVGMEGTVLRLRDQYLAAGASGFRVYLRSALKAYFKEYERLSGQITLDGSRFHVSNLLTLMVFKHPYYGYGMKVIPRARFHDGQLHVLWVNSGLFGCLVGALSALTIGNRVGQYHACHRLNIRLEQRVLLQVDGNLGWEAGRFAFRVLPKALRIRF